MLPAWPHDLRPATVTSNYGRAVTVLPTEKRIVYYEDSKLRREEEEGNEVITTMFSIILLNIIGRSVDIFQVRFAY